jgi:2-keto-4-pentenoate hydratase/2-oxohepta-3-ene-1,7-dioic acid hydratase in catechol pathway
MNTTRREILSVMAGAGVLAAQTRPPGTKFVRYRRGSSTAYGILDGETIREIQDGLFGSRKETGARHKLSEVKLLCPCEPPKVFAVGLNYRSHIGARQAPSNPEIFYKPISALQDPGGPIVIPEGAENVHFEGELVIVIGEKAKAVTADEARRVIFGFTCGNDVSERDWQNGPQKDMQWWRAKGADTFAPLGPAIAHGIDVGKLLLQTRLNGKVMQKQYTSDLLFDPPAIVSWISRCVTLTPGDVIYTGTPGTTSRMRPGDIVEVEIEGIGVLNNPVTAA